MANTPHYGVGRPGLIMSGLGLRGMPNGLPEEFYGGRPRPPGLINQSPYEKRMLRRNPGLFGYPVAEVPPEGQVPVAGLLDSDVPGRTDQLPISVESGAYVIPADVVSGLGQGNTSAGAKILKQIFGEGEDVSIRMARGGGTGGNQAVPIVAAGGEYIVPPGVIKRRYGGDVKKGHDALDKMVRRLRIAIAKQMLKLPGPRRD